MSTGRRAANGHGRRGLRMLLVPMFLVLGGGALSDGADGSDPAPRTAEIELWSVERQALVRLAPVRHSDAVWRKRLTPLAYRVLRQEDTERPHSSPLLHRHQPGSYRCAGCGTDLFLSEHRFDSGTGWPSFWQPVHPANVGTRTDRDWLGARTEVHCARCGGHLGHVFDDGPKPSGLRYCINGAALEFAAAGR